MKQIMGIMDIMGIMGIMGIMEDDSNFLNTYCVLIGLIMNHYYLN